MSKKPTFNFSEEWFLERNYYKDVNGAWCPPPIKSEFIKNLHTTPISFLKNYVPVVRHNSEPIKQNLDDLTHLNIKSKPLVVFNIDPIGAPRMTQSDKWKIDPLNSDPKKRQRKPITQYFKFKRDITHQSAIYGFKMPENAIHVIFIIPMPHSWPDKKKNQMVNSPHQQKPDFDNLIKCVCDSLMDEDKIVWDVRITKYWGRSGKIAIYPI